METLFFFIVLAIIILSNVANVRKKMKAAGSGESEKGEGGWRQTLKDVINEVKAELEKASGESAPQRKSGSGWDILIPGGREPGESAGPEPAGQAPQKRMETAPPLRQDATKATPRLEKGGESLIENRQKRGDTPDARMARAEKRMPPPDHRRRRAERPVAELAELSELAAPRGGPGRIAACVPSVDDLRNAFIWYEILGPPVSQRDPEQIRRI